MIHLRRFALKLYTELQGKAYDFIMDVDKILILLLQTIEKFRSSAFSGYLKLNE